MLLNCILAIRLYLYSCVEFEWCVRIGGDGAGVMDANVTHVGVYEFVYDVMMMVVR